MTRVLEEAFGEAAKLSEGEQNALGEWLLAEIRSEGEWERAFGGSQGELARLAEEALAEHRSGASKPLDPDDL